MFKGNAQMFRQENPKMSAQMKLAQSLMERGTDTSPIQHPLQGIARLAQALSGAYIQNKTATADKAERGEAMKAFTRGMGAKQWEIPEGEIVLSHDGYELAPGEAERNAAPAGGFAGASYALSQLPDNYYAQEMAPQLVMQEAERKRARLDKETDRFNANVDRRSLMDYAAGLKTPPTPKTIKTAEGVFIQNPDGTLGKRLGGAPAGMSVNLPPLEKKEDEAVGKYYGQRFKALQDAGAKAITSNARLNQARRLVESVPASGAGAELRLDVKKIGKALGMDVGDVSTEEGLRAIAGQISLDHIEKTKGAVSDKENARFDQISPGLSNTKEGNLLIIDIAKRGNDIAQKAAKLARDWRRANGSMGAVNKEGKSFEDVIAEMQEGMPLFSPEIEKRISELNTPAATGGTGDGGWKIRPVTR